MVARGSLQQETKVAFRHWESVGDLLVGGHLPSWRGGTLIDKARCHFGGATLMVVREDILRLKEGTWGVG